MKLHRIVTEDGEFNFDEFNLDIDSENSELETDKFDEFNDPFSDSENDEDDNKEIGILRTIPNASLVYKRKQSDGTFEEMWIFNVTKDNKRTQRIYNDIVSGSDIEQGASYNEDRSQSVDTWSIGNVQMVLISGLAN